MQFSFFPIDFLFTSHSCPIHVLFISCLIHFLFTSYSLLIRCLFVSFGLGHLPKFEKSNGIFLLSISYLKTIHFKPKSTGKGGTPQIPPKVLNKEGNKVLTITYAFTIHVLLIACSCRIDFVSSHYTYFQLFIPHPFLLISYSF